jgi:hypothetical protein
VKSTSEQGAAFRKVSSSAWRASRYQFLLTSGRFCEFPVIELQILNVILHCWQWRTNSWWLCGQVCFRLPALWSVLNNSKGESMCLPGWQRSFHGSDRMLSSLFACIWSLMHPHTCCYSSCQLSNCLYQPVTTHLTMLTPSSYSVLQHTWPPCIHIHAACINHVGWPSGIYELLATLYCNTS